MAVQNNTIFDNAGLEILPLITKERTQKFDLLLHLIPNLKQHIILCGESGIGKTLLLDMLYDIDSDIWQCCFVQGSAELSFETVEAQLTKTMLRNKHASLESALHDFTEQHKKIVLIIDDAGLLVSGLMTMLIDYAASQPALKLIFSLTPQAKNTHRNTDKALEGCYLIDIPPLNKQECDDFLRYLATKPRTYNTLVLNDKTLEKIYHDSNGIPAKIIADFTKMSHENQNDYTKWLIGFAGVVALIALINQGIHYFQNEENTVENAALESTTDLDKKSVAASETQPQTEQDIVLPEFKLDIEKGIVPAPAPQSNETTVTEKIEKAPEPEKIEHKVESEKVELEKSVDVLPTETKPEKIEPAPLIEKIPEPEKIVEPAINFPPVEPANGMKIAPLPEKKAIDVTPISTPKIKIEKEVKKVKVEPVKKNELKLVEKIEVKKPNHSKVEITKKNQSEIIKEKSTTTENYENKDTVNQLASLAQTVETQKATQFTAQNLSATKYKLQLITLSSEASMEAFKKAHPELDKNSHVVKYGTNEKPRFSLMYGDFTNIQEAEKARGALSPEFANALPRKSNP